MSTLFTVPFDRYRESMSDPNKGQPEAIADAAMAYVCEFNRRNPGQMGIPGGGAPGVVRDLILDRWCRPRPPAERLPGEPPLPPRPPGQGLQGGQCRGKLYRVFVDTRGPQFPPNNVNLVGVFRGPIGGIQVQQQAPGGGEDSVWGFGFWHRGGSDEPDRAAWYGVVGLVPISGPNATTASIVRVEPVSGVDDCGPLWPDGAPSPQPPNFWDPNGDGLPGPPLEPVGPGGGGNPRRPPGGGPLVPRPPGIPIPPPPNWIPPVSLPPILPPVIVLPPVVIPPGAIQPQIDLNFGPFELTVGPNEITINIGNGTGTGGDGGGGDPPDPGSGEECCDVVREIAARQLIHGERLNKLLEDSSEILEDLGVVDDKLDKLLYNDNPDYDFDSPTFGSASSGIRPIPSGWELVSVKVQIVEQPANARTYTGGAAPDVLHCGWGWFSYSGGLGPRLPIDSELKTFLPDASEAEPVSFAFSCWGGHSASLQMFLRRKKPFPGNGGENQ